MTQTAPKPNPAQRPPNPRWDGAHHYFCSGIPTSHPSAFPNSPFLLLYILFSLSIGVGTLGYPCVFGSIVRPNGGWDEPTPPLGFGHPRAPVAHP